MFDLLNDLKKIFETYRYENFELLDNGLNFEEISSWISRCIFFCANLQVIPEGMQHSSSELRSAVTILKQVFIINFFSKKRQEIFSLLNFSHISNRKLFFDIFDPLPVNVFPYSWKTSIDWKRVIRFCFIMILSTKVFRKILTFKESNFSN